MSRYVGPAGSTTTCPDCERRIIESGGVVVRCIQHLGPGWPYGPPEKHEPCCRLHENSGRGYCDCKASDASDTDCGEAT
jgi:hypothetical protein